MRVAGNLIMHRERFLSSFHPSLASACVLLQDYFVQWFPLEKTNSDPLCYVKAQFPCLWVMFLSVATSCAASDLWVGILFASTVRMLYTACCIFHSRCTDMYFVIYEGHCRYAVKERIRRFPRLFFLQNRKQSCCLSYSTNYMFVFQPWNWSFCWGKVTYKAELQIQYNLISLGCQREEREKYLS